jgi:hypothetical protein
MWICAVSCREMLPDPAFFATCMREAFEDLKRAAARVTTVEHPRPVPRLPGPKVVQATREKAARKTAKTSKTGKPAKARKPARRRRAAA